ncbi:MAG: hypothetical protein LBP42_05345 [Treponema sp.]|nr:hypothetical protein [Treponema sp.]
MVFYYKQENKPFRSLRSIILGIYIGLVCFELPAQERPEIQGGADYAALFEGFFSRDSQRISLELEKERAVLELEKYARETGTAFTLTTGDGVLSFSPSGASLSVEPGVELSLPRLGNTALSLSTPLRGGGDGLNRYGVDAGIKTGIISGQGDAYQAGLAEKERALVRAQRNLQNRRLGAEREFCQRIQQILGYQNKKLEAQGEVIRARYDLEAKRAGGYGSATVIWRTSELKLRTRERELREAERTLETALRSFAGDCGAEQAEMPRDIPDEPLIPIGSLDPAAYAERENALWTYEINTLSRKAQDRPFSLDGNAGYSWQNSAAAGGGNLGAAGVSAGSSLRAGLGFSGSAFTASAGVSVPLENPDQPSLTFRFLWKPGGGKIFGLDKRLRELAARREWEAVMEAEKKYRELAVEYERRLGNLEWQRGAYQEEEELYRVNAEEQKRWFDQGIIRETDYLDAQTDHLLAVNRVLSARIDRRLYNLELRALFVSPEGP